MQTLAQAVGERELLELDAIYQALRAPNTSTGRALTIDAVRPFSIPGIGYSEYLPGPGGNPVQIRTPDGTHLTSTGALQFARTLTRAVASGPSRSFWRF